MSVGQIQQVLREPVQTTVERRFEVAVSKRITVPAYELATGERVIVSERPRVTRPEGIDGVLRLVGDGKLKWDAHALTDAFSAEVETHGWPSIAANVASGWDGAISFRAERPDADGAVAAGAEGLRPPQLGALHAIGAHWSVFRSPATVVMPTGTGKTETMLAALAAYVRGLMLVVVPSDVLRSQTAGKFLNFGLLRKLRVLAPDVANPIVGVMTSRPRSLADLELLSRCNVVVTTMSSISGGSATPLAPRIAELVDTLVVDEAHHIAAGGWSEFRDSLRNCRILQFTATPFRRDGRLVDGQVIYNYPLRQAQQDGYFKPITFEPVHEIDEAEADRAIAACALGRLRADLAANLNHLMMARCSSIERATAVHAAYVAQAPDLNPLLVHSDMPDVDAQIAALRSGDSRIVVCVAMLGEGFDLPQLKVAALHDLHKSLAILLQFTGRFTRSAGDDIGDATVVANIADVNVAAALERLYSEDADWNQVLSELSSDAARAHAELVQFLKDSRQLGDDEDVDVTISNHLLRPTLSTITYRAAEFHPARFHEGLGQDVEVHAAWLHGASNTLYFVSRHEPQVKWMRSKAMRDREWSLFVLHWDEARHLLFLSSTDHSSQFEKLASAVGGEATLISGDQMFRALGNINRLIFQNIGVKKHGRRNLRYAMYTGADVAEALTLSERAGSVKSNVSGTGWEDGRPITIGCSYKGRVWSREQGPVPRFVEWSEQIGAKLLDDTINTADIIANVLVPTEVERLPDKAILGVDWPIELLGQSEERVVFSRGGEDDPLSMLTLVHVGENLAESSVTLALDHADGRRWASYAMTVGGELGYSIRRTSPDPVSIAIGRIELHFEAFLTDYPPLIRFVDLTELDGNLLIAPQNIDTVPIPAERFEVWDWDGVDITRESIWKGDVERQDSIQWRAAMHFADGAFDIVFDDDGAGEAADLVCLKEEADHIRLVLAHCKFSGGNTPGERVKDVVEVSSQAVRSAKWKWKFKDLCRHVTTRERRLTSAARPTRFLKGRAADLNRFIKASRFKEVRPEILIVQPGLSQTSVTPDQSMVLGAALTYLKETIGVDLDVICSG